MPYNLAAMSRPTPTSPSRTAAGDGSSSPASSREDDQAQAVGWLSLPEMRYQNPYVWFVFFSALDIMLTWAILRRGGEEVNPVADHVIQSWGLVGAILFKFSLTLLVVIVCEVVGRKRYGTGLALAITAMCVSALPVVYSLFLLMVHTLQNAT